ncbi:MAG: glycosyltransferase [Planctomycetota bacterium]
MKNSENPTAAKSLSKVPGTSGTSATSATSGTDSSPASPSAAELPLVLHVRVVTGPGGGPEKTILNSPRFLGPLGYRAKLAYLHPPQDPGFERLRERAAALHAELISLPDRGAFDFRGLWQLIQLCRRERVAIWHAHDYKSNVFGLIVRCFARLKLVTTLHGWTDLTGRIPLYMKIDKWCLKYYRKSICVSDDLRDVCLEVGVPPDRCEVVYNAIDTVDYQRTKTVTQAKAEIGAPPDGVLIGAVARLSPEKAFDRLIEATVALRRAGYPVHLWIAGEGGWRPDLERIIEQLDCGSYVRLLGHIHDPKTFYQALDIFALSSIREGLPNVVLEAMAYGTPLLATAVNAVPVLVEDQRSGVLVEPGDTAALERGLRQLLDDPDQARQMGIAARQRVEEKFSFQRRMEKIARIYREVLSD